LGKTKNKIVIVKATFEALSSFKREAQERAKKTQAPTHMEARKPEAVPFKAKPAVKK